MQKLLIHLFTYDRSYESILYDIHFGTSEKSLRTVHMYKSSSTFPGKFFITSPCHSKESESTPSTIT